MKQFNPCLSLFDSIKMHIPLMGFITLLLFSCNDFKEKEVTAFGSERKLLGVEALKNNEKGGIIFITDTLILLGLPKHDDHLYAAYGIKSQRYLGKVIKKGKGMEEFSSCLFYGQHEKDHKGIKIWISDFSTKEINLINISESLKKGVAVIEKRISFLHEKIPEPAFIFYTKGKKVAGLHNVVRKEQRLEERFFLLNPFNEKVLLKEVSRINITSDISPVIKNMFYSGMVKIHPNGNKIVDMKRYQPKINVLDSNGTHLNGFILQKEYPKKFEKELIEKKRYKVYNKWVDVSEKFIYVLRIDQSEKDLNKGLIISVLDWEGASIKNLLIPNQIQSFAVAEKSRIIYGLDSYNQKLFKYNF